MKKFTIKDLVLNALIGAIYFVLVFIFSFASFGEIQFRIAEVLLLLVLFNPKLSYGLLLGTFLANLLNPLGFGILDAFVGTAASLVGIMGLLLFKKIPIIGILIPTLANGLIVGAMLSILFELPYIVTVLSVSIGEFAVLLVLGLPLYYVIKKRDHLVEHLK